MPIFLILIILVLNYDLLSQDCDFILNRCFNKIDSINTISFYIIAKERFGLNYKLEKAFYKIRYEPYSLYFKQIVPPTNAELLINEKYKKNVLVSLKQFPFINLKLDPYGETLRKGQHHVIFEAGYRYLKKVLLYIKNKYNISWNEFCQKVDFVKINEKIYFKLTLNNSFYKIQDYIIPFNTTPQKLAQQLYLCDYKIIELNNLKSVCEELQKGKKIKLPSDYAQKIVIYIEKNSFLIHKIEIFDEKGLFEEYLFENVLVNPKFSDYDFSENNKEYGF
jgi:hypothetical protein